MQLNNRLLSISFVFACLFTAIPAYSNVEIEHLNRAKTAIKSKHYANGYAQFKKLADNGCPFSQCILGIMHQHGTGGAKKNISQSLYWFQKSARQGFADAEKRLGLMYYSGDGIPKDLTLAKKWLTRAAAHGAVEVEELLAKIPPVPNGVGQSSGLIEPQTSNWTMENIRKAWLGYADVTKQLDLAAKATQAI